MSKFKSVILCGALLAGVLRAGGISAQDALDKKADLLRADARRVARLRLFVTETGGPRARLAQSGLKVGVALIADLHAFEITRAYLEARDDGSSHAAAVEALRGKLENFESFEKLGAARVTIDNPRYKIGSPSLRVYTIGDRFPGKVATLTAGRRKIPVTLLEKPKNMRLAKLRIKKFWRLLKGRRRAESGSGERPGWEPVLSKPMTVSLIEEKPAEFDLVFKQVDERVLEKLQLRLSRLKRFDGPFKDDLLDLNDGREWTEIDALTVSLRLPPEGAGLPREVRALLAEVKAEAR